MRTFVAAAGAVLLLMIVSIAAFIGYSAFTGKSLDASSKAYVDDTLPAIVSSWSKEELLKRASPQLIEIINKHPDQLDKLFGKLSGLGALKSYEGSKGDSNVSYTTRDGKVVTAAYRASAKFQNGEAEIIVRIIQVSGEWKYLMFNVNSPIFLQ